MGLLPTEFYGVIARYQNLPLGVKRIVLVGCVVVPLIAAKFGEPTDSLNHYDPAEMFIIVFVIYWVAVSLGLWIHEGFKDQNGKT